MSTGLQRQVMPWPELSLTEPTDKTRYRFNWTAPAAVSQHNSNVVYHGGNVLFRTADRGRTWTPISPDLTRNDKATQGFGGTPITNEGAGGEVYGAIVHIAESPHDANTIYVGTDDGLVQLTRDGGRTWTNVTPTGVGVGLANMVEVSSHDPGTVYLALRMDRRGDYAPYPYKSTDYGTSWTRISNGLRDNEPVRVIREDPERRGLLYAGTETGVYVSYDAGANWQPFSRNLPITPITDLTVRHGDLYAATEGRAFWALDDLTPLRQMNDQVAKATVFLFAPRAATLGGGSAAATTTAGRNPPLGASVFFTLAKVPDSAQVVTLEFLDAGGTVLRSYPRAIVAAAAAAAPASGGGSLAPVRTMPNPKDGLNAFQWDLRADPPTSLPGNINIWGGPSGGYLVSPGKYQVRLTVGSTVLTQPFEVRQDPRLNTLPREIAARDSLTRAINTRVGEIHDALLRLRDVKEQVSKFMDRTKEVPTSAAIAGKGKEIVVKVDTLEPKLSTKAANGQDVINYRNGINAQYAFLQANVEGTDVVSQPSRERFAELETLWSALRAQIDTIELQDVPAFNKLLKDGDVSGVIVKAQKPKIVM